MTATLTHQVDMFDKTYNGWTNYETWNVVLWMENDEGLYNLRCDCECYEQFVEKLYDLGITKTRDGVAWNDSKINVAEINGDVYDF
jgi:hypothetical protein